MLTETARPIAVIGMACRYPGAGTLTELWENVLTRRQQFRDLPDGRLPLSEYHDPDPATPDRTYGRKAAVLDGFEFDPGAHRIPRSTFEGTDIVHWLALHTALEAVRHARLSEENLPRDRAGMILGNTLTGEETRSNTLRLRWPFVRRVLRRTAELHGLAEDGTREFEATMERLYKSVFPPITEDTLAGGLANTIAGRICNYLDLHGGGYIVDGACSSSLLAIATAADYLHQQKLDLVIAGGVDVSLDTFELIGFSKATALTRDEMRVYDRRGSGFIPGEGCGMVVLKRLEDARRDGDTVYAVLRGWGVSSDGRGGITAPSARGQAQALIRAYQAAGYPPQSLAFVEGHGTGTAVGDRIELEGIAGALAHFGQAEDHAVGLTSFKSIVGHTKAAAGIGGFIKTVIALNRRVIPPTAGCTEPHPGFADVARGLYPVLEGEIRPSREPLRAGVSAMGFGGINCHVTIESGDPPAPELAPALSEQTLLASRQLTEVLPFSGRNLSELLAAVRLAQQQLHGLSSGELIDLAAHCAGRLRSLPWRAAVVAGGIDDLAGRLRVLEQRLQEAPPELGESWRGEQIWIGHAVRAGRVGFLFPGQGSQQIGMAQGLVNRFAWAGRLVEQADAEVRRLRAEHHETAEGEALSELYLRRRERDPANTREPLWMATLTHTENAQPAICAASWIWKQRLEALGLTPMVVGGHSLGELTALAAAGAYDFATLMRLAALRGIAMSSPEGDTGSMGALACDAKTAHDLVRRAGGGYCVIANRNSPLQTVISGEPEAVRRTVELAVREGMRAGLLPVSNGFHSRLVEPAAERFRQSRHVPDALGPWQCRMFSSIDGREISPNLDLKGYLAGQIVSTVDFTRLLEALSEHCDWFVEVGPGQVLSGLAASHDGLRVRPCLPVEGRPGRDADLNAVLAEAFARGLEPRWAGLYENRLVRPLVPANERKFYVNPCERELAPVSVTGRLSRFSPDGLLFQGGDAAALPELAILSETLTAAFCDVVRAEHAALLLLDEEEHSLRVVLPPQAFINRIPADLGIFGEVLGTGHAEAVEVLANDPRFDPALEGLGVAPDWTALYVPIPASAEGGSIGVVRLARRPDEPFTALDAEMIGGLASSAAPAFIRAYLQQRFRETQRIDHLLRDVVAGRAADQSPWPLLANLVGEAKALAGAEHGAILLYDPATHELCPLPDDPNAGSAAPSGQADRASADAGIAGHVLRTREPIHLANARTDSRFDPQIDGVAGVRTRSIDCMPILNTQGEPLGVLQLINRRFPGNRERLAELGRRAGALLAHRPLIEQLRETTANLKQTAGIGASERAEEMPQNPAETPQPNPAHSARAVLLDLICQRTGFAADSIGDDARLIDDLNLDSIKIGTLLADAAIQLGVAGKLDPMSLGGADVGTVIAAFEKVVEPAAPQVSVWDLLLDLVAERTGFGRDCLGREQRLLDDLNIDSIKAAALLGDLLLQTGTQQRVAAGTLANATLGEIAERVQAALARPPTGQDSPTAPAAQPAIGARWVRAFHVAKILAPLADAPTEPAGETLLIAPGGVSPLGRYLAERLGEQWSGEPPAEPPSGHPRALVLLLENQADDPESDRPVPEGVEQLAVLHRLAGQSPDLWQGIGTVAFVQRTGGRDAAEAPGPTAWSFAASLYLERPELAVAVLDFDPRLPEDFVAARIGEELSAAPGYRAVEYDGAGARWTRCMRPVEPEDCTPRTLHWSPRDVLLVTGGGKGITAECALAFARETGVRLALVGRSEAPAPGESGELAATLTRLAEAGIEHRYYAADVADRAALERVITRVRDDLGPVTGVLHGAGSNTPRRVTDVSAEAAELEIAPKLRGAENLLALFESAPPKLFAAFTSIIGVTGMKHNAWYAYSNEAVARLLAGFGRAHPETAVVSYAFGVWDAVGMGVKLGSVRHLGQMGIDAIPPEEGVRHFLRWSRQAPPTEEVIVTASSGGLATWARPPASETPPGRFDGSVQRFEPGIERVTRVTLDTGIDQYLADHDYRGSLLLPTVMGLEAMAQASLSLAGEAELEVVRIEAIRLERPIVVSPERPTTIEIRTLALERQDVADARIVEAALHVDQTGWETAHFAARFVLGRRGEADWGGEPPHGEPLGIVPALDLYGGVLFQGPLFQRINAIEALDETHVVFHTEAREATVESPEGFAEAVRAPLVLGDPYYRDTLLQASQLSLTPEICLPVYIDRIEFYASRSRGGRYRAEARVVGREGLRVLGEVTVFDQSGHLIERIIGYEVQILERRADFPTPAELVEAARAGERAEFEDALVETARRLDGSAPVMIWRRFPELEAKRRAERRDLTLPVFHAALREAGRRHGIDTAPLAIRWRDSGKPEAVSRAVRAETDSAAEAPIHSGGDPSLEVSLSHEAGLVLCVAGKGPQGCDLVTVVPRTREQWRAMLNEPLYALLSRLEEYGEPLDRAGARVWAASEAAMKAYDSRDVTLAPDRSHGMGIVFRAAHAATDLRILTYPGRAADGDERVAAVVLGEACGIEPLDAPALPEASGAPLDHRAIAPPIRTARVSALPAANSEGWSGWLSAGGQTSDFFRIQADFSGENAKQRLLFRFPLAFKDGANLDGTVYFVRFFEWMGRLREMALRPVLEKLAAEFASGERAWVTNRSWAMIERPVRAGETVEVSCRFLGRGGPNDSMVSVGFEWQRVTPTGGLERLATSQIQMTWAKVLAHGVVSPEPYPPYLERFFGELSGAGDEFEHGDRARYREALERLGADLWRARRGPASGALLAEQSCGTSPNDANLVGNIYYSKYYELQGALRDSYFFGVVPEAYQGEGNRGAIRCIFTEVRHLRDAMPFDTLTARMYVNAVHERGLELRFEFFRSTPAGKSEKLATGLHLAAWMEASEDGAVRDVQELPAALRDHLLERAATDLPIVA